MRRRLLCPLASCASAAPRASWRASPAGAAACTPQQHRRAARLRAAAAARLGDRRDVLLLRVGAARGPQRHGRRADARLRGRRRRARPSVGRLLLRLRRHADPRRPAARPLRTAPADDGRRPRLRRRLRAVRDRRLARHGHRRPLPDRRLGGLQPGGRHGDRRAMVCGQSLRDASRASPWRMGMAGGVFGQAPLRLAIEASDWRTTMLLLAAGGAVLAVGSLGHGARQVARQRRHGRCAVGSRQGAAPSPDPADRADRARHVRTAARVRRSVGRAVSRDGLRHVAHVGRRR